MRIWRQQSLTIVMMSSYSDKRNRKTRHRQLTTMQPANKAHSGTLSTTERAIPSSPEWDAANVENVDDDEDDEVSISGEGEGARASISESSLPDSSRAVPCLSGKRG